MSKYGVGFQIDNGFWYQGGKLEFQQDKLVITFLGRIKEVLEYSKIVQVHKTRYMCWRSVIISGNEKLTIITPSLFSYNKLCDDFKNHGIEIV